MAQAQRPFYIAIAVIVIGGGIFLFARGSGGSVSIPANPVVTSADTTGFRGYILGAPSAPVEITEYADFECPHCAAFDEVQFPDVKTRLIDTGKARWRFRDWPIDGHKDSRLAAHAAACADDQQRFWEMKTQLFARQNDWTEQSTANAMSVFSDIAKGVGLDVTRWDDCMKAAKYAGRIQASFLEGNQVGVNGTPSFVVAGRLYDKLSSDDMVKLVDSLIAAAPKGAAPTKPTAGQ